MLFTTHAGNRQKKANALIEASGLRMIAVEDFDKAALLPKMRVQCRMSNMQPKAPIIWCRATVRAHAATLHHNSIQHTYNPKLCTNQNWTIQGQNKLSWDEPN